MPRRTTKRARRSPRRRAGPGIPFDAWLAEPLGDPEFRASYERRTAWLRGLALRPRLYALMARAVEEGVRTGWTHAHKYAPNPTEEQATGQIASDVMLAIGEAFSFGDDDFGDDG